MEDKEKCLDIGYKVTILSRVTIAFIHNMINVDILNYIADKYKVAGITNLEKLK